MKTKLFVLFAMLFFNHSLVQAQSKEILAKSAMLNAEEAYNKGDYTGYVECIDFLNEALINLGSTNSRIQYLKAKSYIALGNEVDLKEFWISADFALKLFFECTTENSYVPEKYEEMLLSVSKVKQSIMKADENRKSNSLKDIKKYDDLIIRYPNDPKYYANRGNAKKVCGLFEEALLDFNKSIELNGKDYRVFLSRGDLKMELKDYPGAVADYKSVIELTEFKKVYQSLALAYLKMNDIINSEKAMKRYIEIDSFSSVVYYNRGLFYLRELKNKELADKDFRKSLLLINKYIGINALNALKMAHYYYELARVHSLLGNKTEAIAALRKYFESYYFGYNYSIGNGSSGFVHLEFETEAAFDNIRNTAEYAELVKKYSNYID